MTDLNPVSKKTSKVVVAVGAVGQDQSDVLAPVCSRRLFIVPKLTKQGDLSAITKNTPIPSSHDG